MRINHNLAALNTYGQLNKNTAAGSQSLEKLSSGLRINKAGDDAAGLAISEKMRGQIRGLDQASRNAQDGISMIQTAEGALAETHSILQRVRELAVQGSNDTATSSDRAQIQKEVDQLVNEVDRIGNTTQFNTKNLLDGNLSKTARFASVSNAGTGAVAANVVVDSTTTLGTYNYSVGVTASTGAASEVSTGAFMTGATTTAATGASLLTSLYDTSGSLGISVGDEITVSAVVGGEVKSTTFVVAATSTMTDLSNTIKNTLGAGSVSVATANTAHTFAAGGTNTETDTDLSTGAIVITGQSGTNNAITALAISAKSSTGADRTSFNAVGDDFNIHQVAANSGDRVVSVGNGTTTSFVAASVNSTISAGDISMSFTTLTTGGSGSITVGQLDQSANLQIGANESQTTNVAIGDMRAEALGIKTNGVNVSMLTKNSAADAISTIDTAINTVSSERAKLGALQNRLDHTINNLSASSENLTASESRVRDVDMAKEMMNFTKNNILMQASQAMLAQANQQPQGVLQLLR